MSPATPDSMQRYDAARASEYEFSWTQWHYFWGCTYTVAKA